MGIQCAQCNYVKEISFFSKSQRAKFNSRCIACINGCSKREGVHVVSTARENLSTEARPCWPNNKNQKSYFEKGVFRFVSKGVYTNGPRCNQPCVYKWLRPEWLSIEEEFFRHDDSLINKAISLVEKFNDCGFGKNICSILVNRPTTGRFPHGMRNQNRLYQLEPFIADFQKFNSNSGWSDDSTIWGEIMQALSHFSYHVSGGQYVLCDIQGGIYSRKNTVVLTDPAILSRKREFGITDLGAEGINAFFFHHDCNEYCRSNWSQPKATRPTIQVVKHTTMLPSKAPTQTTTAFSGYACAYYSDSSDSDSDFY